MSGNRYKVENSNSTGLCLTGLSKTSELDCSANPLIEVVELHNSPGVTRILFGDDSPSTSRSIRIGGEWSGSIHIDGSIRSLEYISTNHYDNITLGSSQNILDPRLRVGIGALITNSLDEMLEHQGRLDDLLFLSDSSAPTHVEIGLSDDLPFRHLGISGPSPIETLTIHCVEGGAESILLYNLPNLRTVHINGQTKLLETSMCQSLRHIHGQGDILRRKTRGFHQVAVSGIWGTVNSPHPIFNQFPTTNEILTCSDISWVHIPAFSYDTQIRWSEIFDIEIHEVMEGIPIQRMVELLQEQGDDFFENIEDWTTNLLTPVEQYIGMRLVASLCLRGLSRRLIWRARDSILAVNKEFSNQSTPDISQRFTRGANWFSISPRSQRNAANARFGLGLNCWSMPEDSHLPLDRLDIEIWVETGGVGEKAESLLPKQIVNKYSTSEFSTFISAALDKRDDGAARERQDELMECLFEDLKGNFRVLGSEFDEIGCLLTEYGVENIPEIVDLFIDTLLDAQLHQHAKIAIGAALLQYLDDIRLRSLMMRCRSSPEIGRAEANTLHALSLAGRRAYTNGRIPPLEWPAIQNWRNMHER